MKFPNIALGFTAGFTGQKFKEMMNRDGIKNDFIELDNGFTRINVKIKFGKELDINANGPEIGKDKIEELFGKLGNLKSGEFFGTGGKRSFHFAGRFIQQNT